MTTRSDAKLLHDLGHPIRLGIVRALVDGEKHVSALIEVLGGLPQGRVSSHLT